MSTDQRAALARIRRFDQLIAYLRDELDWPIGTDDFENLTFEYTPEELGIDSKNAAKIEEIRRLRPLAANQPWGIFFVKFEPKRLPVVALRRILGQVALKKRAYASSAERQAWAADDLLFVSNYGEGDQRQISFAHFSSPHGGHDLPTLKVLGWDNLDTALHLDAVAKELTDHLCWPDDEANVDAWRVRWSAAFTLGHREIITTSRDLSLRLAELARAIRDRIKTALAVETERGPLTQLLKAFREALVHDLDADRFADMYAQTIAYGLLSARIVNPRKKTVDDFTSHLRTNPFLRELMETFLQVGGRHNTTDGTAIDFDELGVSEVVDLLDDANMEAVVSDFGDRNPKEDPVIHFYEDFLAAYDKEQKVSRGVFYTPRPVVSYIVRSVDETLRTEFGLEDGLADTTSWREMTRRRKDVTIPDGVGPDSDFVQILDPACGTGTFLVEVIDVIRQTLLAKWAGQDGRQVAVLWNEYVSKHLLPRLHGYELLMAPYAIAHLKIGLKLYETGYQFASDERARVYLTNALEPAGDAGQQTLAGFLPALAHEATAVNKIKLLQRFTVVIGNPPYSGVSSNMSDQAQRLIDAYKRVDGAALNERKLWLQDDYVKFIRLVQMSLERTGIGILGYITNHGYVGNPTFRGMRQSLMGTFQSISVLDLHGNANKQERSPDGSDDKNVFDIRQGVAILLATRASIAAAVMHADLWGERQPKYDWLIAHVAGSTPFTRVDPDSPYYFFEPLNTGSRDEYMTGWPLNEIMPVNAAGFITARDFFVVDLDESALSSRIAEFSRPDLSDDVVRDMYFKGYGSAKYPDGDTRSWKLPVARARVRSDSAWRSRVAKCLYRPFDERFVYWADWMVDWPRPEISGHLKSGRNISICFNRREELPVAYAHFLVTRLPCEHIALSGKTTDYQAPLWLYADPGQSGLGISESVEPNLAPAFLTAISSRLASGPSTEPTDPNAILQYIYAVVHSPTYRIRYAELLRTEFPRVPLPGGSVIFNELARLGDELVAVHLMESPRLEQIITTYIGPDNPHVGRVSWSDDTVWLDDAAPKKSAPANPVRAGFRGVPEAVWAFHVGSYHVCEKWLKDRKGRTLSDDDLAHYQKIVVALSESIRLMTEVDEVIEANGGWPAAFRTEETKSAGAAIIPFRPRIVRPTLVDRYAACVPLVPLEIAAGAFGDPQHVEEDDFEWVALDSTHRLRPGMFVAQVVGKSMEPAIPDGSYCLFSAPVAGSRVGKTVLVQLRDGVDPETGERYTVKRYDSQKDWEMEGLWQHRTITLRPNNPAFQPIVLTSAQEGDVKVIAELVEVLHGDA